jgi:hypothetical protein
LRRFETSFPSRVGHLVTDDRQRDLWAARYSRLGEGIKVGIAWRGGREVDVRRKRSTTLQQWSPILRIPGLHFINLQYGDCEEELAQIQELAHIEISDWDDANPLKDLDFFAAQIAALDLVISVDNATVHIAGALGKPVWTLLPFASDWRWMLGRDDTPWYPTMRLIRQSRHGAWPEVFHTAALELRGLIGTSSP